MNKVLLTGVFLVLSLAGMARADEMKADTMKADAAAAVQAPVQVNNKICPISGHEVGKMGPAKTIEYKGKVYNLCCAMCEKDFNKDPEAAIKKIEEGMEKEDSGSAENAAEDASEGHEHDHAR